MNDLHQLYAKVSAEFKKKFVNEPLIVRSPGRINLIGEHTDYNEGFVFPAAINKEIALAIAKNQTQLIRLCSLDEKDELTISLSELAPSSKAWANYLLGVVAEMQKDGNKVEGFDLIFSGNIPIGAGLSSSAALENAIGFGLNELFQLGYSKNDLAKIGQQAEHMYAGTKCGIMDQFASINGEPDKAMLLDCKSLEYKLFPLELGNYELLLIDTKVKHALASSAYNDRRADCEESVEILQSVFPELKSLRGLKKDQLEANKQKLSANQYKRSHFVLNEIERTLTASEALKNANLKLLGELMYATHEGLSVNYEVSCPELDFLVSLCKEKTSVLGARMMGGGFGGCTINIVHKSETENIKNWIKEKYTEKFQIQPNFYQVNTCAGTGLVDLETD